MKKLFFLLFPLLIQAQDVPIGFWKDYQSYTSASYITEGGEKIYCVTNGGLFYINTDDNTLNRMSKVNGLSDIGIKQVAYDERLEITVIIYENCNIDLLKNNRILNISDIKRKEIIGNKAINNITIKEGIAYLSCTFGLVLIDLEKEEIKDTYKIGVNGNFESINSCAFNSFNIFVATEGGVYSADIFSTSLFDFNSWELDTNRTGNYWNIFITGDSIWTGDTNSFFSNNLLFLANNDTILIYENLLANPDTIINNKLENTNFVYQDSENNLWVADGENGLLKYTNYEYQETFAPEGPASNSIFSTEHLDGKLHICHGGHVNYGPLWNKSGASIMTNDDWVNYDYYGLENARDIVEVTSYNGVDYYASYYNGIPRVENGEVVEKYSYHNTNGALDTILNWQWDKKNGNF